MKRPGCIFALLTATSAILGGCEGGAPPAVPSGPKEEVRAFETKEWGEIYGRTLQLHVPIPEPRKWQMAERGMELAGVHTASHSKLVVTFWEERDLQNRSTCRAGAERDGLLVKRPMTVLEEHVVALPDAYDTRFWVAVEGGRQDGRVAGHVYATGAFLKKCFLFHFESSVPSEAHADILGGRLAAAQIMLSRMKLDPPRIGDDGKVAPERAPTTRGQESVKP